MAADIERILEMLNQFGYIRTSRIIGDYYQIYCPFHNDGNEKKPSCGVLLHDIYRNGQHYPAGWFHCFTCSYVGTLVDTLNKIFQMRNISISAADWLKENVPGFEIDVAVDDLVPTELMEQLTSKFALQDLTARTGKAVQYVPEAELAKYRFTVPYMYERKLTDNIIEKYDIGYDANWIPPGRKRAVPCITFPVRDRSGKTLFLCRRSIQGKLYNYPEGVQKPVYGIEMIRPGTKSVIICESCINALTAVSYGYSAVALLGTGNAYQMSQLKELGVQEFVVCTDGDEAGRRAASKLKRALRSVAIVWIVNMPDGKDLNDLSKDEFINIYNQRE